MASDHDFDAIWRASGAALWRAVYVFAGGQRAVADDAVAEAFARAMEHAAGIQDPVPYMYRVAFRLASEDLRRMREKPSAIAVDESQFAGSEEAADVMAALARISPFQRAAIYLHYHADLPVKEVAAIIGTSGAAVRVHMMRGRRRLAELLVDREVEVES